MEKPTDLELEEQLELIEKDRPADVHETPQQEQLHVPDEEDVQDLLLDIHGFLEQLLERKQSKWINKQGTDLKQRIGEIVAWAVIH